MLPEVGATELLVVAAVALIVVGPKDLPILMRKLGQWIGKMRGLASEFRSSFDELARQSELDELRKEVEALRNTTLPNPLADMRSTFDEVGAGLDPHGYSISDQSYSPSPEPAPAADPAPAPKPRARKPKAEAGATPAPVKPRAKTAPQTAPKAVTSTPAKPRATRAKRSGSAEA